MADTSQTLILGKTSPKSFEGHWLDDGSTHDKSPKWAKYHAAMASEFPSP